MTRQEWHLPGDSAPAERPGTSSATPQPAFAAALNARLETAGDRVRQECTHLDHVEAVASEYLSAARPPRMSN